MKKFTALLLTLGMVLSFSACGNTVSAPTAAPTVPSAPQTEPTTLSTEPADNLFHIGNLTFDLTPPIAIEKQDGKLTLITIKPEQSFAIAVAQDISQLNQDQIDAAVQLHHRTYTENKGISSHESIDLEVCGFPAIAETYVDITGDGAQVLRTDVTFTDTWYVYTIQFYAFPKNDDAYDLGLASARWVATGEYHGPEPREVETLETYPLNVSPEYVLLADSIPEHIYTTTGSENGLAGTVYAFDGTVVETYQTKDGPFTFENAIVEISGRQVMIGNTYKAIYDATVKQFGVVATKETYHDSVDQFIFPEIGVPSHFIVTYAGYSDVNDMPAFVLGANPAIFEMNEWDDPANSTPVTPAANDGKSSPTTGERNALQQAKRYLNMSAFSYSGLIDQLKFEEYTDSEAVYAVDNCGADWNEQALKKAKQYLRTSAFSYSGLFDQLKFEGFTDAQATYGVDGCGADWNQQAVEKAEQYLQFSSFSRDKLISQLQFEGFTYDQAVHGADEAMQ